ncbi:MAG: hypothetical protein OXM61_10955 [Candidatus Poribacteria bacterium]|nr:hypothetical protein [Candidatus Poribacteria bacterium]
MSILILILCISLFVLTTGLLLSWYEEVKQRRERRERLNARVRRVLKNR